MATTTNFFVGLHHLSYGAEGLDNYLKNAVIIYAYPYLRLYPVYLWQKTLGIQDHTVSSVIFILNLSE